MQPFASLGALRIDDDDYDGDNDDNGDDDDNNDGDFFLTKCWGKSEALVCLASTVIVLYPRGMQQQGMPVSSH